MRKKKSCGNLRHLIFNFGVDTVKMNEEKPVPFRVVLLLLLLLLLSTAVAVAAK